MLAYAINRKLTAQVLGNARLVVKTADWARSNSGSRRPLQRPTPSMARWDPEGKGYTVETVAFDLAHLAARAVDELRATPGWAKARSRLLRGHHRRLAGSIQGSPGRQAR